MESTSAKPRPVDPSSSSPDKIAQKFYSYLIVVPIVADYKRFFGRMYLDLSTLPGVWTKAFFTKFVKRTEASDSLIKREKHPSLLTFT